MEWIIGVLSILVTVLIGWQIMLLFDLRRLRREIAGERDKILIAAERNGYIMFEALADFYYTRLVDVPQEQRTTKYILYKIYSIQKLSNLQQYEGCNSVCKFLIETLQHDVRVRKQSKQIICSALQDINNKDKITSFCHLAEAIYSLSLVQE